jgi:hypothetical protein
MMKINSSQKDWILFRNVTSGNRITFEYFISAEPSYQWWVLYRGVMPDWANLNENKEKWDWVSSNSKTDRKGKVQFDYEFTAGAIYTLALFKDQTENAYDLADYFEFCVPPQDHKLSDRKISGNSTTFYYIVESPSSGISDEQKYQWWVLYRGVMPHWANLNKNKEKWDRAGVAPSRGNSINATEFDYEFTPGAIYTLALFKDQTKDAYELADYMEFCVQPQDDNLSHFKISGNTIEFDYNISAEPSSQWWVLYRGVMPDWANLNENKEKWDRISSNGKTDRKGKVQFDYECTPGAIYTLALFKDQTENAYDLAYYLEFLGSTWIKLHGDNSYCYCACSSDANIKHKHDSYKTMNVIEGAPYFYAVLTEDDDTVDFPTGAVLTIEGPDGTNYDRDIEEENQLVIMSGSSVRCLIIKDPKPGDWKMTMTVPEGVGFHCECNTVPSKDPYKTITTALSKANQLQKRDLSNNGKTDDLGWYALYAVWFLVNVKKDVKEDARVGAITGGAVGAGVGFVGGPTGPVTIPGGALIGAVFGAFGGAATGLARGVTAMSRQMTAVAQANAAPPQRGTFNLLMGERPGTIYPNLENYNQDLTHTGPNPDNFPVEMTRHHIIPYNQLRRFWNRMVQEGHLRNAPSSLFDGITNLLRQDDTGFTLNQADREQAIQLLEDIRQGRVTHDANSLTPNGWDSFQQVYAWMPGNLFFGPGGNFRTGDPGEEFEGDAGSVVGENGFAQYERANRLITQYDRNHGIGLVQDIARILGNIASPRRRQPFALNSANWYRETSTGKYRLRRLP